jgi:hypothetical protein
MIELTAEQAAQEFMDKLQNGEFIVSRSQNSEVDYADEKLNRDMAAVDEFIQTGMIECIKNLT